MTDAFLSHLQSAVVDWLRQLSRPYLFSNTLMPAIAGASLKVFEIIEGGEALRAKLYTNADRFRDKKIKAGFTLAGADHPIIPVMLGDAKLALYGPSLLLRVGGIEIVVISRNGQGFDLGHLTSLGIDPLRCATIALKSSHHFRAAFEPIAREVLMVDGGGMLGSEAMSKAVYHHVRRPIWPLDDVKYQARAS